MNMNCIGFKYYSVKNLFIKQKVLIYIQKLVYSSITKITKKPKISLSRFSSGSIGNSITFSIFPGSKFECCIFIRSTVYCKIRRFSIGTPALWNQIQNISFLPGITSCSKSCTITISGAKLRHHVRQKAEFQH